MTASSRRTSREIRASLHSTRHRLDQDLSELQLRAEESSRPTRLLSRHPALVAIAGAALGWFVLRNPQTIGKTLTGLAQAGAPFVLRGILERGGGLLSRFASTADNETKN